MTDLQLNQIKIEEEDKPLKYRQIDGNEIMDDHQVESLLDESVNLGNFDNLDSLTDDARAGRADDIKGADDSGHSDNTNNLNENHETSSKSKKMFIIAIVVLIVVVVLLVIGWLGGSEESTSSDKQTVQSLSEAVSQRNNENAQEVTQQDASDTMEPNSSTLHNGSNVNSKEDFVDASGNKYRKIAPPIVSTHSTTENASSVSSSKERIDIPGDIVDLMVNNYDQKTALTEPKASSPTEHESSLIPLTHFTIQIVASSNKTSVQNLAKKLNLSHYWIYEARFKENPWFVLIQGNYASSAQAKDALDKLSPEIKQHKPWIKSGLRVEQERTQRNN